MNLHRRENLKSRKKEKKTSWLFKIALFTGKHNNTVEHFHCCENSYSKWVW